jgi:uncharacterized protein (DUF58 family)
MLNKKAMRLIVVFILLLVPGAFFGNLALVAMSLVPLSLLAIGMALSSPHPLLVETERPASPVWAGDDRTLVKRVRLSSGLGLVRLYQPLPPEFDLTEGNNLALHFQWMKQGVVELSFQVELAKRGRYSIPPLEWISEDPLGLTRASGIVGEHLDLEVWPRFYCPRQVKSLPALSLSPFPSADIARIGIPGQDFREIRKYVSGDPIKNINWRATARRADQSLWPLVNEFEREGRKSVLIYLHASHVTEVGSSIRNGLESSIEAATNLLYYYLQRGYRTGIYICGSPTHYLYPETGKVQFQKALRYLVDLRPGNRPAELLTAVETTRDYVLGYNPLTVVVSTIDAQSGQTMEAAVRRLRQMYGRRRRPSIMIIGIDAYGMVPHEFEYESTVSELTMLETRPTVRRLRNYGANVVEWHPAKQTFSSAFSRHAWVK